MLALARQNQLLDEEDLSDWGSDFDDEYCDDNDNAQFQEVAQESRGTASHSPSSLNTSHSSVTTVEQQYLISSNGSLSSGCSASTTASSDAKDENGSNNGSIGSFGSSVHGSHSSSTADDADDLYEIPDGKPSVPIPTNVSLLPIERNANWAKLKAQLEQKFDENTKPKRPTTLAVNKPKPPTKPKPKKLLHSQSMPVPDTRASVTMSPVAVPTPFAQCPPTAPTPPPLPLALEPTVEQTPKPHIEQVLLPTRATKEEDSRNFIESLKRKLSQKNHLVSSLISSHHNHNNKEDSKTTKNKKNQSANTAIATVTAIAANDANINASPLCRKNSNFATAAVAVHESQQRQVASDPELIKKLCDAVQKFPWFYRVDRHKAELILENYNLDGSFLVRECQHGGPNVPFTLTIRFGQRCFHIQIRLRPEDCNFALGTTKLNEKHFGTVQELIDTYRKTSLQLHTNGKYFGETKLTQPPIVYSFSK